MVSRLPHCYVAVSICEVQSGQRVALMGTSEKQCGHSLVVGSAGASYSCFMCTSI